MGLCSPRSCGCAIQSDSLSITGSGTAADPLQIEFGLPLPANLLEVLTPAGTIRATPYATADAGWLLFGASYLNANASYPTLWGKVPAAWKSGTTLVLPTDAEMVLRGKASGLGAVSGANSMTLTQTHMPAHVHAMTHDHDDVYTGTVSADHVHGFSATTGGRNAAHTHTTNVAVFVHDPFAPGFGITVNSGSTIPANYFQVGTGTESADHGHAVSGSTGGISANHQHLVNTPTFTGNTSSVGSGTSFSLQDAGINVRFQIKAH